MAAAAQASCLLALEQADAMSTAAWAQILGAFTAARGYAEDGDYSLASWLIHRTRITKGAASVLTGWVRRAAAHPGWPGHWPPARFPSPTPARSASGPTSSPRTAATRRTRSWPPRHGPVCNSPPISARNSAGVTCAASGARRYRDCARPEILGRLWHPLVLPDRRSGTLSCGSPVADMCGHRPARRAAWQSTAGTSASITEKRSSSTSRSPYHSRRTSVSDETANAPANTVRLSP